MFNPDHLGDPGEPVGHQKGAAADRDQRHLACFGLHAVDRVFEHGPGFVEHRTGKLARHPRRLFRIADLDDTGGDRRIGRGQDLAAEHQRLFREAVTDALRPD